MKMFIPTLCAALAAASLHIAPAAAQGTQVAFNGLQHDSSLPVEITSDQLSVDQSSGKAIFQGDVLIGQGELRLSAQTVEVLYATTGQSEIAKLIAQGSVTIINSGEAIEAERAEYNLQTSQVHLSGNVILTQGNSALSGERMTIDLNSGTGQIDGRVKTILQSGGN